MKLTVAELVEMLDKGELVHDMSTQRGFIYNDIETKINGKTITKAGAIINSIMEKNIQLPALYFWHNTDTNTTHIHDGKQRLLSIYYFIKQFPIGVTTVIGNHEFSSMGSLGPAGKKKLLNYTFDIVERTGNSVEEEESFFIINTSSVNLTEYECLRGMLYGEYLTGFEDAVNAVTRTLDNVSPVGRGEQAIHFLYAINGIDEILTNGHKNIALDKLKSLVRKFRNSKFNAEEYRLYDILSLYNNLVNKVKNFNISKALWVATYVIENNLNVKAIIKLYENAGNVDNDIKKWDIDTHKTFIDVFVDKGIELDARRFFTDDAKSIVYSRSSQCAFVGKNGVRCTETKYNNLEADHIKPWSKGGRTTLDNCQLLCKNHNIRKGSK
jgi:hypothetical protein